MSILIDATGKNCPIPVIMAKNEAENGTENFTIRVDNPVAVENLKRFGQSRGYDTEIIQEKSRFDVGFRKNLSFTETGFQGSNESWGIFITKESIGEGSPDLGASLLNMFLFTLTQDKTPPDYVLFMNAGVKLAVENNQVVEHLKVLIDKGTSVLVCGTCLNFYSLTDQLQAGTVSNMYDIVDAMKSVKKLVTI